jgi:hypothetical protein
MTGRRNRTSGFSHVVQYGRNSALGAGVVPSLLDAASHGPQCWLLGSPPCGAQCLVWLPFSGLTVMGRPIRQAGSRL